MAPSRFSLAPDRDNYCVVGNPVAHSKSPDIHQAFAAQFDLSIAYQAIRVEPDCFNTALAELRQAGLRGMNVTVPFKADAWAGVDVLTDAARRAGSVNTIWFPEDGLVHGDTTDGIGLVNDLRRNQVVPGNKRLLLLGAGGAIRGVLAGLYAERPAVIAVFNRTASRARQLAADFSDYGTLQILDREALQAQQFDIVINGTSASLSGELPSMPDSILAPGACCYDMVYGDEETVFMQWARAHGAGAVYDGLGMLVEQAAQSFYIWTGRRPATAPVIAMLRTG